MFRSIDSLIRRGSMPRSTSALAVKRIMISGPQISAVAVPGSQSIPPSSEVTRPTCPVQPLGAVSTVTATTAPARPQASRSSPKMSWEGSRAPVSTNTRPPSASGRWTSSSMAPRSGASPMPPATTTTSPVARSASPTPQDFPNGPRTPTTSPSLARHRAADTGPTSRTVWRSAPASRRELLTEMAASPTP